MESVVDRQPTHDTRRPPNTVVRSTMAEEAEIYNSSVAGIDIEAVRVGRDVGPTKVLAATGGPITFTECKVGFPMLSRTTIPDDMVIIGYIRSAPPGSRWCEIDLEPGAVIVEAPGAEHTARNLPGLNFMFAIAERQQLDSHADQLGIRIEPPPRGEVHRLAESPNTDLIAESFAAFADVAATGLCPSTALEQEVLRAMTHALSENEPVRRVGHTKRVDSRQVVHTCIDYAAAIGRIPSISELCLVAHVCERRLREAFSEEFDIAPSRFFRAWALNEARSSLTRCDKSATTVAVVASSLGFNHLGRFAGRYKEIFGESPSTTLDPKSFS
jgi:AraC-like DNA-binding protein